ncbi:MAG: DUF1667 domain-containing protein [Spirochaetales bacterium]|nr:DUF1667 domain-containing protein [Spirochaetales bacterium]
MTKEMICISCPIGCHIEVTRNQDEITVRGNKCSRGEIYGKEELLSPKRVVTATCPADSILMARIPVKTTRPIGKELINSLLEDLYKTRVQAPVQCGAVIMENYAGTGVDVVVTKSLSS